MSDLINMLFFEGPSAFTEYREQQLLLRLKRALPGIQSVSAIYIFLVDTTREPKKNEIFNLEQILPSAQLADIPTENECVWVVPRLGTVSPWSSKATEIVQLCDIDCVARVERGIRYCIKSSEGLTYTDAVLATLHDPMTESVFLKSDQLRDVFEHPEPQPMQTIPIIEGGKPSLEEANAVLGLALADHEMDYLMSAYQSLERNPTDAELMMFAQVNSEHCRHKIFNARWEIDGHAHDTSLFSMIRNTYQCHPDNVWVAYNDNAAVLKGYTCDRFFVTPDTKTYATYREAASIVFKVETHNHPTAISPFPGAATGSGGEIRDEAATGCGARPKMGLCGFSVSHLKIPNWSQPWELDIGKPKQMASALDIMLEGPIGAAAFNNEFGRPNLCGYFRTLGIGVETEQGKMYRGYHKPIMIAGGVGSIRKAAIEKKNLPVGAQLIVLGGPAMAIGLGGGAASSRSVTDSREALDFASVQRANPEMERRCQEVIDACWSRGDDNPILSIHDVGAGGLSNALPELVEACAQGAKIMLRDIPNAALGMSPMEIWCNESQERYVLAIKKEDISLFEHIAQRERCPFAVVGVVTDEEVLVVEDAHFDNRSVDLPMSALFQSASRITCQAQHAGLLPAAFSTKRVKLSEAVKHVLQFPCVADKRFLITIGDRSVSGLVVRDQMVGPWQVPVADVAVTSADYQTYVGEAMAMGERAPIALIHPAASARMAVGEAITNIAAANIEEIGFISLSANWMAAAHLPAEAAGLYDAVQTVGMEICPALGISIPVGKDSLSMRTEWDEKGQHRAVTAPMSLIISAAAKVKDTRRTLTPQLRTEHADTELWLIDLGQGSCALGGSVLAQTQQTLGQRPPDVDDPGLLKGFFSAIQTLNEAGLLLAYHDRSDGGLLVTICEMMFAGQVGVDIVLDGLHEDPIAALFNEELGAVVQCRRSDRKAIESVFDAKGLTQCVHHLGTLNRTNALRVSFQEKILYGEKRQQLHRWWSELSYRMQALRDFPDCAAQEYERIGDSKDPGLSAKLTFDFKDMPKQSIKKQGRPKVAILREQGVNGHVEMAAAFDRVGFTSVDVHMTELLAGDVSLLNFAGFAACGGFSYGDVLQAGRGWAQSILMHDKVRDMFSEFFEREDRFALGICNGCQMLSHLKSIIPGAEHWPRFHRNRSEQFEARLSLVQVQDSSSLFFQDMAESVMPVAVAHGEGRAVFENASDIEKVNDLIALRYVDHQHQVTEHYPENPNGSPDGIAGLTTPSGRVTIMMPHPERVFRSVQLSWHPDHWGEDSPWTYFFKNALKI